MRIRKPKTCTMLATAVCAAITGCASAPTFDEALLTASRDTVLQSSEPATEVFEQTTARLPTADSRLGPWLLSGGDIHNRLYLSRLRERGIQQVVFRVAYPTFAASNPRRSAYEAFYTWLNGQIANYGMRSAVIVSPQFRDDNYYRGISGDDLCADYDSTVRDFSDHVITTSQVHDGLIILDLKPSSLESAAGCRALVQQEDNIAEQLLDDTLDALPSDVQDRLAIGVPMVADADYRDWVISHPRIRTVSVSTLDYRGGDANEFLDTWHAVTRSVVDQGKRVVSDSFWMRKPVKLGNCAIGESDSLTDTANVWQALDSQVLAQIGTLAEFVGVYETDLLFGGYLDAEQFECGNGFHLKNRRLSQLSSRQSRRYPAPTDSSTD